MEHHFVVWFPVHPANIQEWRKHHYGSTSSVLRDCVFDIQGAHHALHLRVPGVHREQVQILECVCRCLDPAWDLDWSLDWHRNFEGYLSRKQYRLYCRVAPPSGRSA